MGGGGGVGAGVSAGDVGYRDLNRYEACIGPVQHSVGGGGVGGASLDYVRNVWVEMSIIAKIT